MADPTSPTDPAVIAAYVAPIASVLITAVLSVWIDRKFYRKPKLLTYIGHISSQTLPPAQPGGQPLVVNTHSIIVANQGSAPARNVMITLKSLQDIYIEVVPVTPYTIEKLNGQERGILFPRLAPKQRAVINFVGVNVGTTATMVNCICDEQVASHPNTHLVFKRSPAIRTLQGLIMGAGIGAILVLAFRLLVVAWKYLVQH